jgi:DNA-binding NarL/FixJ family response regulator
VVIVGHAEGVEMSGYNVESIAVEVEQLKRCLEDLTVRVDALSRTSESKAHPQEEKVRTLTLRERQVYARLMEAKQNKEIAAELNVSARTVGFHVSKILKKFGVSRRTELLSKN